MRTIITAIGLLLLLLFLASDVAAQAVSGPSAFCHITDGALTVCPDANEEWSDITPTVFPPLKFQG